MTKGEMWLVRCCLELLSENSWGPSFPFYLFLKTKHWLQASHNCWLINLRLFIQFQHWLNGTIIQKSLHIIISKFVVNHCIGCHQSQVFYDTYTFQPNYFLINYVCFCYWLPNFFLFFKTGFQLRTQCLVFKKEDTGNFCTHLIWPFDSK